MLRLALCEHLRTQVCTVHLVVVLYGFNNHEYEEEDDVPVKKGKLCYAAVTQSEIVLLDVTQIGYVRNTETASIELHAAVSHRPAPAHSLCWCLLLLYSALSYPPPP